MAAEMRGWVRMAIESKSDQNNVYMFLLHKVIIMILIVSL
ncbi:hypothetical protein Xmau_02047 [Xenorhabdus mauleonii]|uniref:Uncharacterized protein n=1 Tax=Xenorhabdus mauleonii TaxID=351675 RepID=A0A1I3HSG6_9GAMM|nr:hypothetical protein Xmau_02047 [Xenorhabdus mauleonii]SFI38716.1 hypothetical protein SAMN05421680_10150 [Xenorhabdus mauleonii]